MNRLHGVSGIFLVIGIVFFLLSGLQGDLRIGIFLIFPFVIATGIDAAVGFFFIILAFFLFILGFSPRSSDSKPIASPPDDGGHKQAMKGGGIVLLGPIPIIIGSSWKMTLTLILATFVLLLLVFFLLYFS